VTSCATGGSGGSLVPLEADVLPGAGGQGPGDGDTAVLGPTGGSGGSSRRAGTADGFLAHRGLIGVSCGIAMAEAAVLAVFAPAARALAPQVTALPPLAIFHDLRWLYSTHRSWLWFALLLAGLLLVRSALNTALVLLAWPTHLAPPRPLAALRSALVVTAFACLLISPLVSLTFGVAILPFSWPFLAMLPAMLLIALPLSHAGVADTWWRTLPTPAAAGWLLAEFVALTAAAAVIAALPIADAVPLAGLAGLVNARAWYGLTGAAARSAGDPDAASRPPSRRGWMARRGPTIWPVPAGPLAVAVVIAIVVALTRLVFVVGGHSVGKPTGHPVAWVTGSAAEADALADSWHHPVLEVAGFGSWCCGQDRSLARALPDTVVQQFSYRGTNSKGQSLPYGAAAANIPLPVLGDRMAAQVWRLHDETGKQVDVVAESEGTLGVYAMLARHPHVPVSSVVLLSPIVAPGQAGFRGASGTGLVTRDELHALIWFVGGLSPFGSSGAQTLIDSVNRVGAQFAAAAAHSARVRLLEVVPLADAVTLPACPLPRNVVVVPAFHGELLGDPAALRAVREFLLHRPVRGIPVLRTTAEIMAAAASAWRMPENAPPSPPCRS
jgi:hypothetical protein